MHVPSPAEEGQGPLRLLLPQVALRVLLRILRLSPTFQGCAKEDARAVDASEPVRNARGVVAGWAARNLRPFPALGVAVAACTRAWGREQQHGEPAVDALERELEVHAVVRQQVADADVLAEVALGGRGRRACPAR